MVTVTRRMASRFNLWIYLYKPSSLFDRSEHCLYRTISFHCNFPSFQERKYLRFKGSLWRVALWCCSGQAGVTELSRGPPTLGGCPLEPLSRPAPSRRGSGAGEEQTNTWKITRSFWSWPSEVSSCSCGLTSGGNWGTNKFQTMEKKNLSESSSQAKMQGSSLRDRCVIERGQHEATMKRYELRDARLETVCSSGLSLRSGAKLQFRKCLLFPESGASKRPRGSPEGKYNCCMILLHDTAKAMALSQVPGSTLNLCQV